MSPSPYDDPDLIVQADSPGHLSQAFRSICRNADLRDEDAFQAAGALSLLARMIDRQERWTILINDFIVLVIQEGQIDRVSAERCIGIVRRALRDTCGRPAGVCHHTA